MKTFLILRYITFAMVVSAIPTLAQAQLNVLLICVDDLRPELGCYGVDYILSPNIDALAGEGQYFTRHYVQAPTCGASRFALLTGRYGGASNGALFARAGKIAEGDEVPPSMPAWFRQHGYTTVSVGKVSHHPGGRGGRDWNDDEQVEMPNSWDRHLLPAGDWQHPRGWMHGLANGEIRGNADEMDVFQALEGPDSIYPDGVSTDEAVKQLKRLASREKPFFMAFGILRPHLPFGAPEKYLEPYRGLELPAIPHPVKPTWRTTWHGSGEFMKYNRWQRNPNEDEVFSEEVRRHYAACVSFADAQVGRIIATLKESGKWDNTVVVLWGDHGWHLGEHAVWGKHTLFEESLRSPLILRSPKVQTVSKGCSSIVETIDVFPTLCELTGLPVPEFACGQSLAEHLPAGEGPSHEAISYSNKAQTIRTEKFRLIAHKDGYNELYNWSAVGSETKNVATANPEIVEALGSQLKTRLAD